MMNWHDTILWNIRPDCKADALAALAEIRDAGLHRDNIWKEYTSQYARWFEMDVLPIDMLDDGIAVVSVIGPLVNLVNPFTANYPLLTASFDKLRQSNDVRAVVVRFKTPGGTVSGLQECAAALDQLADEKLTIGQVDGGCYSAGYFLAARCGNVFCGATDHVGSIGTITTMDDYSEAWKQMGIRSVTKKTGDLKCIGVPGDPITPVQEEFLNDLTWQHFGHFRNAVMTGRSMTEDEFEAVSDGAFWLGETAVELKLIDGVSTMPETIEAVRNHLNL